MTKLSTAAWIVHDVGLATSIGGTLFGQAALEPALSEISDAKERQAVEDTAWKRFSWMKLAGHVAVAATWFYGRTLLSGREVSKTSRSLTLTKDALVIGTLVTGVANVVLGRMLSARKQQQRAMPMVDDRSGDQLRHVVSVMGVANLAANVAVAGVTTALAMEGNESTKFSFLSRFLP